jgi:hypothetical protein
MGVQADGRNIAGRGGMNFLELLGLADVDKVDRSLLAQLCELLDGDR